MNDNFKIHFLNLNNIFDFSIKENYFHFLFHSLLQIKAIKMEIDDNDNGIFLPRDEDDNIGNDSNV